MTASWTSLLHKQVELTQAVLHWRNGMDQHLRFKVLPHLDPEAREIVLYLLDTLDEEEDITSNFTIFLDNAIVAIRTAITDGTTETQFPIPRERLIGCDEAFDTETVLSSEAEALQAALPPVQKLYETVRQALDFAEAIRLSIRMLDPE